MLQPVAEFAGLLRQNGLRVSTAELLDAVAACELLGVSEPALLQAALQTTLIKRQSDIALFNELFALYFHRTRELFGGDGDEAPLVRALREKGMTDDEIEHLLAILADEAARLSPVARMGIGLRRNALEALLRLAAHQIDFSRLTNPLQVGFYAQQLIDTLRFEQAGDELRALTTRLAQKVGDERAQQLRDLAEAQLAQLRAGVRGFVRQKFELQNAALSEASKKNWLYHKPFSAMSEMELQKLRGEVDRLAQKLRDAYARRPKRRRRGRLDLHATLRRALGTGGVPFRLAYRHKKIEKPRLVILCDISDSVRHVSRFMLQFAFTLQERFEKVRSFAFVSDLAECTQLFAEHELDQAVDATVAGKIVSIYANSNYGRAFRIFEERYLDAVTKRTTVIVIGDGRANYTAPEVGALQTIKDRARRLIWFNPEASGGWGFGDSVMHLYEPLCERVEVVSNLATLSASLDRLVL